MTCVKLWSWICTLFLSLLSATTTHMNREDQMADKVRLDRHFAGSQCTCRHPSFTSSFRSCRLCRCRIWPSANRIVIWGFFLPQSLPSVMPCVVSLCVVCVYVCVCRVSNTWSSLLVSLACALRVVKSARVHLPTAAHWNDAGFCCLASVTAACRRLAAAFERYLPQTAVTRLHAWKRRCHAPSALTSLHKAWRAWAHNAPISMWAESAILLEQEYSEVTSPLSMCRHVIVIDLYQLWLWGRAFRTRLAWLRAFSVAIAVIS